MVDCKARAAHLDRTASTRDKARLQCLTREGVWYWLTALPCQALSLHLAKQKFVFAAKCCLGLLVFLAAAECPVRRCCAKTSNLGDHPSPAGLVARGSLSTTTCKMPCSRQPSKLAWCPCGSRRGS